MSENPAYRQTQTFRIGERIADYAITGQSLNGGMGEVYPAAHVSSGQRAAIKTVRGHDPATLEYFRHEIITLAALDHPAIVPIRDHGVERGKPWCAMDWVEAPTLRAFLRPESDASSTHLPATQARDEPGRPPSAERRPPVRSGPLLRPLSRAQLLDLCVGVLRALDYVHSRGVVHGDLKPENIFVLEGPRPLLVDFGVAQWFALPREALALIPRAVGSVQYMAPEQVRGELPDARADLYALGCLLYECATGVCPFQRTSVQASMLAQLNFRPEPPSKAAPELSGAFDSLVLRLLSKSPADRPAYARDVLEILASQGVATAHAAAPEEASPRPLARPELVGRSEALRVLSDACKAVCSGRGAKLRVTGENGIGKTRLILEAVDLAKRQGMVVFCARCADSHDGVNQAPLAPLRSLLEALSAHELGEPGTAAALSRALANTLPPAGAEATRGAGASSRDELLELLTSAVFDFCSGKPTLLLLDDLDRAEELTRGVVRRLLSQDLTQYPLLLVYTDTRGAMHATDVSPSDTLELGRLTRGELELVVRSTLASEYASPRLVDHAYQFSEGNPFLLGQCLRALIEASVLVHSRERGWHLGAAARADSPLLHGVENASDLFRLRLDSLSSDELELASVAAVLGRTFQLPMLAAVAEQPVERTRTLLTRLCALDIVDFCASGWYQFSHALLRELLYERVPEACASELHARAALEVETALESRPELAGDLAVHASRAGQHLRAARYFEAAALLFANTHRHQQALDALEAAKRELGRSPWAPSHDAERLRVGERLGDAALLLRRLDKATAEYTDALALAGAEVPVLARLHRKLAAASQRDHDLALRHLKRAIALLDESSEAELKHPNEWLQAHLDSMFVHYWKRAPKEVLALGERIKSLLEKQGSAEQRAAFHFNVAAGLMALHRYVTGSEELRSIDQALDFYVGAGDRLKVSMASFLRAMICLFGGDLDSAQQGFETLLESGEKASSVTIQLRSLTYLCLVHRRRRSVEEVRRVATSTLALAEEHDMPEYQGIALGNLAWLAYRDASFSECERLARSASASWSAAQTKNAFCWTALLPLLAALIAQNADHRDSSSELPGIAVQLLDESQQALPQDLTRELELLASLAPTPAAAPLRAQRVLDVALGCGLL